jgi:hypothetical protein
MAHYKDLTIDQGSDLAVQLHLVNSDNTPKDLSDFTVAAKLSPSYSATDSDKTAFAIEIVTPEANGIVNLSLTNAQTDSLKAKRKYVYDVEISYVDSDTNTITERIMEGQIFVTPSVTK